MGPIRKFFLAALLFFVTFEISFAEENFGELETDSKSWLGRQYNKIISAFESCGKFIVNGLKKIVQGVYDKIIEIWDWTKEFFTWAVESVRDFYQGFLNSLTTWWEAAKLYVTYIGEVLIDWFYQLLDWLITLGVEFLKWMIDYLPEFELPYGFNDGLRQFCHIGMIMNDILPVEETLELIVFYFTVYLVMVLYSFIKSYIPFV